MTTDRDILFGADLALAPAMGAFDLKATPAGDLALASGADDIRQALILRLLVRRGELAPLGWPDYGSRLHELIGEPNNQRTHIRLMGYARAAIEADPRVVQVASMEARRLPGEFDTVRLDMDIDLILQNTPLNLVFDVRLGNR